MTRAFFDLMLVRKGGVEPPRPYGHTDLNRARLPIPPLARTDSQLRTSQPRLTYLLVPSGHSPSPPRTPSASAPSRQNLSRHPRARA
jgi:hypothetical protein